MPDKIVHIRSLTAGSVPTTASFGVGEIAINVADGKAFLRQSGSIGNTVQSFVTTNSITSGSVTITGSIAVNGPISATSFTGSLFGTASWAVSSSRAVTSSYAITASYALNGGSGGATNTGSLLLTASVSSNTITFTKGDGSTFPITVDTGSGGGGGLSGGTAKYIPLWNSSTALTSSILYQTGSTIALGIASDTVGGYPGDLLIQGNTAGAGVARIIVGGTGPYQDLIFSKTNASGEQKAWSFGNRYDTYFGNSTGSFQIVGVADDDTLRVPLIAQPNGDLLLVAASNATNGNVGIGTTTPAVKLHVQSGSGAMGFPYEIAAFERNGDTKIGVFSSADSFPGNGVSVVLGYTNVLDENSYYPGYEFQYVGGGTQGDNYVRYNFIERDSGGNVVAAVANLFNIYANGNVTINNAGGATSQLGIGTDSPVTTLHVYNVNATLVAHFEGVNGYPIEIVTTDESFSGGGYAAAVGSIGNSVGTLHIKTGSADLDWAPVVYERGPMPERTFPNLTTPYYITSPGIYEITTAGTDKLYFPDPSSLDGQRITVVNADGSNTVDIDSTYAPYLRGDASQMSVLGSGQMYQFVSIGGKWRGMRG